DFAAASETQVTATDYDDSNPRFSPDGNSIAFTRDGRELVAVDLPTGRERVLARGLNTVLPPFDDSPSPFAWSPKGQWVAYIGGSPRGFDNVYVAPAAGEASGAIASAAAGTAGGAAAP